MKDVPAAAGFHALSAAGDVVGDKKVWFMTTPCLQGWTRYGGQQCSGLVDWGFVAFDIDETGQIAVWHDKRHVIESSVAKVYEV